MDGAQAGGDLLGILNRPARTVSATFPASVTILLSTYNGEKHLQRQLDSFLEQTQVDWHLAWRDDGSSDATCAIMERFSREAGRGRCVESATSGQHVGAASSFLRLLKENEDSPFLAFADQDDCWLPAKLQRSLACLGRESSAPALYCARQILTNDDFSHPVPSMRYDGVPGFPASLTQNIATGNTIVMNGAAAQLICSIPLPEASNHDWWSYIVVSACGGSVVYDEIPCMLYRQHAKNTIGSKTGTASRAMAALDRGGARFMTMMRRHAERLDEYQDLLPLQNIANLQSIRKGLAGGYPERISALRCRSFTRARLLETLLFRLWFLTC